MQDFFYDFWKTFVNEGTDEGNARDLRIQSTIGGTENGRVEQFGV